MLPGFPLQNVPGTGKLRLHRSIIPSCAWTGTWWKGLAESREKAKRLIAEGRVRVEGKVVTKPAHPVPEGAEVALLAAERYVGRGAYKLLEALEGFPVAVQER